MTKVRIITPTGAATAWATLALALVTFGVGLALSIGYTAQQSRKICGVIVLIDDRNQKLPPPPPTDPDTAQFRQALHRYRLSLGC